MVIDHAGMAFDGGHLSIDSVTMYSADMAMPLLPFLTRWITHLCAPTFVFLAGTALALSIERRKQRGEDPRVIDKQILTRGFIIAILDPTLISFGSGRLTFQVLYAIGISMMFMAGLRRFSTLWLIICGMGWILLGEVVTVFFWNPDQGWASPLVAATMGVLVQPDIKINYPVFPWLSMMVLGWAFGVYLVKHLQSGDTSPVPKTLLIWGFVGLALFLVIRWVNGYGNMFLFRLDNSLIQWLHVSKYPPSESFISLELGLLCVTLAALMYIEPHIKIRRNGLLLVFGQTAMFFYLAHRLAFEITATYFGFRGAWGLWQSYIISGISLIILYPACLWYRTFKQKHPKSVLRYF